MLPRIEPEPASPYLSKSVLRPFAVASALVALCVVLGHGITSKWLYCSLLGLSVSILVTWVVMAGLSEEYDASFHWESGNGVTAFTVLRPHNRANPLWQRIMRSQVEPDLNGYLRIGGTLERTDGDVSVTVTRIVPICDTNNSW